MVTHARRVFAEELDYEQLEAEQSHTFQLDLQAMWEDRFRLVKLATIGLTIAPLQGQSIGTQYVANRGDSGAVVMVQDFGRK